ncbi:MAG: ribonuclease P protein component [Candidatus Kerfeldbacteria bacterium CG15_BIG_FIL_POST_REV_8_21_14_020_45_12]|uniref:Ribonuclease P protein component n=1 Tax=Candidatus Kerfeldbacteria bacterium CG15_BIG_FIL_POST_REV_8_21_14_020_45_12 TaxID=2014247 RepID=A0A2M7H360_9BACT|nr:MAG: ribonuclease P protein component [Candidatus Kerfeldbacteria bacterium CG15_BIG_FIL_POST_REV_8_21_14_020_45_12]PJA93322.1 MAG: ribonuclease P protein component [Candidatus Kerfeldbacteria bacterium CG_4_9_14_3_um_filter_45_8]
MLPADYRLRHPRDFERIYKEGKTLRTALFRLKTRPNGLLQTRVGIVVPNKIIKSAVARNRTKRQIRNVFEELILSLQSGYDIVALAQPGISEASHAAIKQDLVSALSKIRLLQKTHE